MFQTRMIGEARVTRVLEYSGPTHALEFLFPGFEMSAVRQAESWLAPNHWVPAMERFIVTIQLWVVHAGSAIIIVDTGVGNRKPRPAERMNMLNSLVLQWLEAAGAPPDRVTHVVMTHLHTDHVGWNTVLDNGRWVPTFPNARYLLPRVEYDFARQQFEQGTAWDNSFADSVVPIVEAGLAEMIPETGEAADCLTVKPTPGHTPGQIMLSLRSQGEEGIFCGDIFHNPIQIAHPDLNSRYCLWPEIARSTRAAFLSRAAESGALLMPTHFGAPYCGYVRRQEGGYGFEPASW